MENSSVAIVAARDQTLNRMVEYFMGQLGTTALFLSGSLAAETADACSDIDFRVVVAPEHYDSFLSKQGDAAAIWGDLLFTHIHPSSIHSVSHFRPFLKVDTFYYRADQLLPSPWYMLPTKVLFDPEHLVQRVIEASRNLAFIPSVSEVEQSISLGLAAAHEAVRRVSRGELAYAHAILDELRRVMVDADDYLNGRPWCGFSHFETRAPPGFVAIIHSSYCPLEAHAIAQSLLLLAEHYRSQVLRLHQKFPLTRALRDDLDAIGISLRFREAFLIGQP